MDGLPPDTVTPDPEVLERIRKEAGLVATARTRRDDRTDYTDGFIWPAQGRLSGFYGSQRILNGEPRSPHYGVDVAAPTGTPVVAPAPGIISFAHPDLYYSGGTIILDHGQGLSSTFLHLSEVLVEARRNGSPGRTDRQNRRHRPRHRAAPGLAHELAEISGLTRNRWSGPCRRPRRSKCALSR